MIPKYIPILRAMEGEFSALENLDQEEHRKILPLFEFPTLPLKLPKWLSLEENPTESLLAAKVSLISASRKKLPVLFDFSRWQTDSKTEAGMHVISFAFDQLIRNDVEAIPVIGYDRWSDDNYSDALINLDNKHQQYCMRLEAYAFEDMIEEEFFLETLNSIIDKLNINTSRCSVILDFGDVTASSTETIQQDIITAFEILKQYNFKHISTAGCSLTTIINNMVEEPDSSANVLRLEAVAWKAIKHTYNNLIFGDYGIVNPNMSENIIAPDANGKIRYTIPNNYLIARGHSRRRGNKGEQMWDLSQQVVDSMHYMGSLFSWGDQRIHDCSNREFKGNPSQWVAIDTNHHINAVLNEVFEFEKSLSVPREALELI